MIVLGLNAFGHDAAAVLLVDGDVVFASSQERFDRVRHSAAYPQEAAEAALAHAGLEPGDVDAIAFPWTRGMARWQKAWHVLKGLPRSRAYFTDPPDSLLPDRKGYLRAMRGLEQRLRAEGFGARVHRVPHHLAHAASGALALPGGTGGVVTADGMGEWTTAATWRTEGNRLERLRRAVYPHSPGKAYAAVTQWLGFVPESGEGKTMGLAGYGALGDEEGDEEGASDRWQQAFDLLSADPGTYTRVQALDLLLRLTTLTGDEKRATELEQSLATLERVRGLALMRTASYLLARMDFVEALDAARACTEVWATESEPFELRGLAALCMMAGPETGATDEMLFRQEALDALLASIARSDDAPAAKARAARLLTWFGLEPDLLEAGPDEDGPDEDAE